MYFLTTADFGDHIAHMVAVDYMKRYVPNIIQHCYVPDYFLDLAKNLVPGVIIKSFSQAKKPNTVNPHFQAVQMHCDQHNNLGNHLVDVAFDLFVGKDVEIEHKNYCKLNTTKIDISKFNLPEKYVVLTTGFTAEVREMLPKVANEIIDYCKSKNIPVVTLGSRVAKVGMPKAPDITGTFKSDIKYNECLDLVDKTTLLEAGKIIENSIAIIGLDNGLLHLAACTEVPIIAGFTTVLPEHRLPYRHDVKGWNCYTVEPDKDLGCRGCQSRMTHVYGHNFTSCYYRDTICKTQLTSDKYIKHLEKLI